MRLVFSVATPFAELEAVAVLRDFCVLPVVVAHDREMHDAWCLATRRGDSAVADVVKLYGRRFTKEATFSDTKGPSPRCRLKCHISGRVSAVERTAMRNARRSGEIVEVDLAPLLLEHRERVEGSSDR